MALVPYGSTPMSFRLQERGGEIFLVDDCHRRRSLTDMGPVLADMVFGVTAHRWYEGYDRDENRVWVQEGKESWGWRIADVPPWSHITLPEEKGFRSKVELRYVVGYRMVDLRGDELYQEDETIFVDPEGNIARMYCGENLIVQSHRPIEGNVRLYGGGSFLWKI